MKKFLILLVSGGLFLSVGISVADEHEGEADEANVASPVELFACSYNEGKTPADLDAVVKKFNSWADKKDVEDYSAWTLVPYYASPEQEFDLLWLGVSEKAKTLGRIQDMWLATGEKVADEFDAVIPCNTHLNFAALQIKAPPKRENPSNIVISFSDCKMADGVTFGEMYEPLVEWGKYKEANGSTAGMWVFFPAYGGGGEDYDFKFLAAWQNLEDQGADYDQHNEAGWRKAGELFEGKVDCDSSRVYLATSRRLAKDDDE